MGIFIDDDTDSDSDIEGGVEHALSHEAKESLSPVEERLRSFAENNAKLESAIEAHDLATIESLEVQVAEYRAEQAVVQHEIADVVALIETKHDSRVMVSVLTNEKMRLERWVEKVNGYIARYEAYLAGSPVPHTPTNTEVANLIVLWHERVEGNIQTLTEAVRNNDLETIELLGNSLDGYKKKESEFERTISDMNERIKSPLVGDNVRAILSNDILYLLDLLDDVRYYISEYSRVLRKQVSAGIEF